MATTSTVKASDELDDVLHQLRELPGIVPDTPEYALIAAKVALQFACGGKVVAYRLQSGWKDDGFRARYEIVDDLGGTFDEVRTRLAGRSDVQAGDVEIGYIDPLDAEPTMPYVFESA